MENYHLGYFGVVLYIMSQVVFRNGGLNKAGTTV